MFLEETFGSSTENPRHRLYATSAQHVLKELLPATGIDLKGYMKSYRELLKVSQDADKKHEFDELIEILDTELRLITPTDRLGGQSNEVESGEGRDAHCY